MNCADEDCNPYSVDRFPTVRVFGPHYSGPTENVGRNVSVEPELKYISKYWYETILREIKNIQREEQEKKDNLDSYKTLTDQGMKNLMAYQYVIFLNN